MLISLWDLPSKLGLKANVSHGVILVRVWARDLDAKLATPTLVLLESSPLYLLLGTDHSCEWVIAQV